MVWKKKNPPMFIKLRAKRFWGRLTVQERGAGLGDIFTQNTLSAIKAVCQVLGLSLCGRGGGAGVRQRGGGEGPFPMETTTPTRVQQLGGPQQLTHTYACRRTHKGFFFPAYTAQWTLLTSSPCAGDLSPPSAYPADFLTFRSQLWHMAILTRVTQREAVTPHTWRQIRTHSYN